MRVLVACETSGVVREAFRERGHFVKSCDLMPSDDGSEHHWIEDVMHVLLCGDEEMMDWDLIVMHPTCTSLCVSGNRYYGKGKPRHQERLDSIRWTMELWNIATNLCEKVCMENPVGVLPMKPNQYVQPFEFGHPESKKTGLYLHGLPNLRTTNVLPLPESGRWENQTPSGQNKLGPSPSRAKARSRTYTGIAQAMATQWSNTKESNSCFV